MPFKVQAKLEGLTDVLATLIDLKQGMRNRILRKAFRAGAKPIIKAARQLVPQRTRQMKRAMGVVIRTYTSGVVAAVIGVRKGFKTEIDGKFVDPANYLHLVLCGRAAVEAGTKDVTTKSQRLAGEHHIAQTGKKVLSDGQQFYGTHVAAVSGYNFLQMAFEQAKSAAITAIASVVQEELEKYKAKKR